MPKTLICIVSKQLLPNYLFLKDFTAEDDTICLVTTTQSYDQMDFFYNLIKKNFSKKIKVQTLLLESEQEEQWLQMQNKFLSFFPKTNRYLVNLTGGTKYMAIALYKYFGSIPNAKILYSPWPKNVYLDFENNECHPIKYSVNREEYFALSNLKFVAEDGFLFKDDGAYSKKLFGHFLNFTNQEHSIFTEAKKHYEDWSKISSQDKFWNLLEQIEFPVTKEGFSEISRAQREKLFKYLFGCWFEEYVRSRLADVLSRKTFGAKGVQLPNAPKNNELDCVIVENNKCILGECKTFVEKKWQNEAINKAHRINKSIVSTLSAKTYFFYINSEEAQSIRDSWNQAEKEELLRVYGKEYFIDEEKFTEMVKNIKRDLGYENVN